MDLNTVPNEAMAAGGFVATPFVWLVWKKLLTLFTRESAAENAAGAQNDVISQLREEVTRLANINKDLAEMVNELQRENIELKKDISELHSTINKMGEQLKRFSKKNADFSVKIE